LIDADTQFRFWNKVRKTETCWIWIAGCRGKTGYGSFKLDGKTQDTHRVSWIIHFGQIPNDLWVLHTCDNRKCVNPTHLFLGTPKVNHDDMVAKGRKIHRSGRVKPVQHGTCDEYKTFGCRCELCKEAVKEYQREYRKRKKSEQIVVTAKH